MPRWIVPLVVASDAAVIVLLSLVLGWPAVFFAVPVVAGSIIALVVLTIMTRTRRAVSQLRIPAGPYRAAGSAAGSEPHRWSSSSTDSYPDWTGQSTWSDGGACGSADSWSADGAGCSFDTGSSSSDSGSSSSSD
ncbi:hypothetical protein [Pseudonocardia oroxyli]|uniref:Uncharacterized protein n=1 Tax=Pseudonocardia oroxyli TaxID=366584 RepID=A0A1G7RH46_PSEOR|nr:hypothetical protein [Pseudonocardia oroxyli]SDG09935.1 hypothetical protein SAMN05216377_10920 [Pseudonocardia oroxyli]